MRLCSQCERQCSWYTQPQPPKLSMHGETCVPVLPHWLPVGHGSDGAKGPRPWRGTGGCERQEGGRGGRGGRRENGGGWNGRWGREAAGGRQEAGRVRGGERSRCGRWEAVEGGARTFLDQQAPTDRAHARWLCTRAWRSRWCVPQPLARALRGRLDKARLVGAGGLTGPLHATHARADATARDQPASGAGPVRPRGRREDAVDG